MFKYIMKRIIQMFIMTLILIFVVMTMLYYAPQGHVQDFVSQDQEILNVFFNFFHIKEGMPTQYVRYVYNLLFRLDMGTTGRGKWIQPLLDVILSKYAYTLWLTVLGTILTNLVSIPLGFLAALHKGKFLDYLTSVITIFLSSMPIYCCAVFCVLIFSVRLHWIPSVGTFAHWYGYIFPLLVISANGIANTTRVVRATVGQTMDEPYIVALRSKGLPEKWIIFRHAMKNSLISIVGIQRSVITRIFGSTMIVEEFFVIPGVGAFLINAVVQRTTNAILGCTVVVGVVLMSVNILCDVLCILVDPQLRAQYLNGTKGAALWK